MANLCNDELKSRIKEITETHWMQHDKLLADLIIDIASETGLIGTNEEKMSLIQDIRSTNYDYIIERLSTV